MPPEKDSEFDLAFRPAMIVQFEYGDPFDNFSVLRELTQSFDFDYTGGYTRIQTNGPPVVTVEEHIHATLKVSRLDTPGDRIDDP